MKKSIVTRLPRLETNKLATRQYPLTTNSRDSPK